MRTFTTDVPPEGGRYGHGLGWNVVVSVFEQDPPHSEIFGATPVSATTVEVKAHPEGKPMRLVVIGT